MLRSVQRPEDYGLRYRTIWHVVVVGLSSDTAVQAALEWLLQSKALRMALGLQHCAAVQSAIVAPSHVVVVGLSTDTAA